MILEVIAGSVEDAIAAERGGATRIELCVDLDQDGLTPPLPLVKSVVHAVRIPVRVMLRRHNDFLIRAADELNGLCDTANAIEQTGAAGLVLGFIQDGRLNETAQQSIASTAPAMKITFHRAFDRLHDPIAAITTLKRNPQVDCILTSGGTGDWQERAQHLTKLQQAAVPEIEILVGGGVDANAIDWLCRHTTLRAFHAGRAARENNAVNGCVLEANVRRLSDAIYKRKEKSKL